MPSRKQLIVMSLRDLTRRCVKAQIHLAALKAARRSIERDEDATRHQIRDMKARIDRELLASGADLGIRRGDLIDDADADPGSDEG